MGHSVGQGRRLSVSYGEVARRSQVRVHGGSRALFAGMVEGRDIAGKLFVLPIQGDEAGPYLVDVSLPGFQVGPCFSSRIVLVVKAGLS